MTELTVNIERTIHAPKQTVFNAWLDAGMLSRFILPAPGMPNPDVTTDATEGGRFSIIMQVGDQKIPHTGEYLEISPHDCIRFSWCSPFSTDGSAVTLTFVSIDHNATTVHLKHVRFPSQESRDNHAGGWTRILTELEQLVPLAA